LLCSAYGFWVAGADGLLVPVAGLAEVALRLFQDAGFIGMSMENMTAPAVGWFGS
jgi:hypothetical protein